MIQIQLLCTLLILQISSKWALCTLVNQFQRKAHTCFSSYATAFPTAAATTTTTTATTNHMRYMQSNKFSSPLKSSVEDTTVDYANPNENLGLMGAAKSALKIGYKFSRPHTIKVLIYILRDVYVNEALTFHY